MRASVLIARLTHINQRWSYRFRFVLTTVTARLSRTVSRQLIYPSGL